MDDKLNELKEKQAEIGDKISLLRETNKRKDEEAAEIRQLIQECRDNLNRIKGISPQTQGDQEGPCIEPEALEDEQRGAKRPCGTSKNRCEELVNKKQDCGSINRKQDFGSVNRKQDCGSVNKKQDCDSTSKKKNKKKKERVSCKVDLNRMKVRVRGPSEDLKKLDATQLINLLEKFECQELIINTGDEIIKDPGEIRLIYLLHPGNIVMVAGIIMIAFLINTNICQVGKNKTSHLIVNGLYVSSFAFHYGMVMWMTFIRGYALRFGLNHDSFHLVDNIILPKYFTVCVLLSVLTLYSFLAAQCVCPGSSWSFNVIIQISIIVVIFFMELTTICYIVPAIIKLRDTTDDYVFDDEDPDCSVPQSYEKNLIKLRKLSWTLCLINFLTIVLLGANMYYITSQLMVGH